MSAPDSKSRSRSKPAPETSTNTALSKVNTDPSVFTYSPQRPQTPAPIRPTPPSLSPNERSTDLVQQAQEMSDPTSIREPVLGRDILGEPVAARAGGDAEDGDNRSSSLSELGDGLDDTEEATPRGVAPNDYNDNDSEAETERLDNTPRKLQRTATDYSIASDTAFGKSPSKLSRSMAMDDDRDDSPSPVPGILDNKSTMENFEGDADMHSASLRLLAAAGSDAGSVVDHAGRKRKRSSLGSSSDEEMDIDEPARKRSGSAKNSLLMVDPAAHLEDNELGEVEDEEEAVGEVPERFDEPDVEAVEATLAAAEEAEDIPAASAKGTKAKKGKRKGRRANELPDKGVAAVTGNDPQEGEEIEDVQGDDEDSNVDEELTKKRSAIGSLSQIEKKFKIFREKLCDENIEKLTRELEMLKQPDCRHPEYLAMLRCVDERRDDKIHFETTLFNYKLDCLKNKTVAERHQWHSQYFQTVRDLRDKHLMLCNQRFYQLQKERRNLGSDEFDYTYYFPTKRSTQIQQQTAYNLEVSVLSGVAKYVGFPAAPEIIPVRNNELEEDFRAMKIPIRPQPTVRPYNEPSRADRAAAEEQFLEQTPWANPHHPVHQHNHFHGNPSSQPRVASGLFATPAGQRRVVDIHAPNGSASTIEIASNPPSSAAHGQVHEPMHHRDDADSPVAYLKRSSARPDSIHDNHYSTSDIPASQNNVVAGLSKDASGVHQSFSSPVRESPIVGSSSRMWGSTPSGITHISAAAPPGRAHEHSGMPSGVSRKEGSRTPIGQRSSIGVGSGSAILGR